MKIIQEYKVLGLMSGTSLDGLDLAFCHFKWTGSLWEFSIIESETRAYEGNMIQQLKDSVLLSSEKLMALDAQLGVFFGKQVNAFMEKTGIEPDFISSHGHTVFHQPDKDFTLQIGNPAHIHAVTGLPVVADFRTLDVALGGEGAPLVPIGDQLLFSDYEACLNLGGISNISYEKKGRRRAYDIGVCNMLLNHLSQREGKLYDEGGNMAAQGNVIPELLEKFSSIQEGRKSQKFSLGYEWISASYFPLIEDTYNTFDLLATATKHVSETLANDIVESGISGNVLVTGGGAFNRFLIDETRKKLPEDTKLEVPEPKIVTFKEALIFAFLGVLRVNNEVNCLKSVTGAKRDSSSGVMVGF